MKRLTLSLQIAIIFIIAFIATYALLAVNIVGRLDDIFEKNVFDQLESEAKGFSVSHTYEPSDSSSMFAHISYSSLSNQYNASNNIADFIDNDSVELLINKAAMQANTITRHKNIIKDKQIYYVILNYESFFGAQNNDIFILLTDATLKRQMVKETSLEILIACFLAYLLGYLLIYLWINKLVQETKKITVSLDDMGKNHYKTKITTKRQDEIGDLVENIENMRLKIIYNEQQKQEIIQGVSHDLKTPIAIIQSYAEALEDGIYTDKEVSKITLKQCDRLNSKVRKLLTLTRIGYLHINYNEMEKINMYTLVSDVVKLYEGKSDIHIETNSKSVQFAGDEDSWRIVIENLLDNAIRYVKSHITIKLSDDRLSVYNDGKHIPKGRLEKLFNAYEKGSDGNYGLGLSIVKRTVNLFGYDVRAENANDGVEFIISKKNIQTE